MPPQPGTLIGVCAHRGVAGRCDFRHGDELAIHPFVDPYPGGAVEQVGTSVSHVPDPGPDRDREGDSGDQNHERATLNWTRVTRNVSALLRRKFVLLCRRWPSSRTLQCGMLGEVVVPVVKRPASREMILSCECTKRKG